MSYIEESLKALRQLGLKGASSPLEPLLSFGKGELFVLNYLYFRNEAITPSELSKALGSTTARVSAILKALEKKQEIVREVDHSNRNHVWVTLTDIGRSRAEKVTKALDKAMTAVFQEMGEEDTAMFLNLTNRFLDTLQKNPIDL
ncbi:MAG: MarR family winged helix-turn-helix transcriptional regulator, partial [Roseburia sp.]